MSVVPQEFRTVKFEGTTASNAILLPPGTRFSLYLGTALIGTGLSVEGRIPGTEQWKIIQHQTLPFAVTPDTIVVLPDAVMKSGVTEIRFLSPQIETGTCYLFVA